MAKNDNIGVKLGVTAVVKMRCYLFLLQTFFTYNILTKRLDVKYVYIVV